MNSSLREELKNFKNFLFYLTDLNIKFNETQTEKFTDMTVDLEARGLLRRQGLCEFLITLLNILYFLQYLSQFYSLSQADTWLKLISAMKSSLCKTEGLSELAGAR